MSDEVAVTPIKIDLNEIKAAFKTFKVVDLNDGEIALVPTELADAKPASSS